MWLLGYVRIPNMARKSTSAIRTTMFISAISILGGCTNDTRFFDEQGDVAPASDGSHSDAPSPTPSHDSSVDLGFPESGVNPDLDHFDAALPSDASMDTGIPVITCSSGICPQGQFCLTADGDCSGEGVCTFHPAACTLDFDPVCGCDGVTYNNRCLASQASQSIASTGVCPT